GEGDRPKGGGGGARTASVVCPAWRAVQEAPTTMLRMVPLPRVAGEEAGARASFVAFLRGTSDSRDLARSPSLELQSNHAHEPIGHLLVALELCGVRDQNLGVVKINDRLVFDDLL